MSVYCGFATRKQEHVYNAILCKLISLLSEKLIPIVTAQSDFKLSTLAAAPNLSGNDTNTVNLNL